MPQIVEDVPQWPTGWEGERGGEGGEGRRGDGKRNEGREGRGERQKGRGEGRGEKQKGRVEGRGGEERGAGKGIGMRGEKGRKGGEEVSVVSEEKCSVCGWGGIEKATGREWNDCCVRTWGTCLGSEISCPPHQ